MTAQSPFFAKFPPRTVALGLLLIACSVRLAAVLPGTGLPLTSIDEMEYLVLAQNIHLHGTFSYGAPYFWGKLVMLGDAAGPLEPSAGRAPLYPLMIAALWWGDAPPVLAVRLLQVVLGGLVAPLVYLISFRAFDARAALLAGLGMAVAPLSAYFAGLLMTHVLFTFLLTLGLWLWGEGRPLAAGIVLGLAALTRSALLPLLLLLLAVALLFRFRRGVHLKVALAALVVIAPWTLRNAVTQHAFIPIASMGWGANIFLGTFDVPYGGSGSVWTQSADEMKAIIGSSASVADAEGRMFSEGIRRIARDPLHWLVVRAKQYPRLFLGRPGFLFSNSPGVRAAIDIPYLIVAALFVALAVWGLVQARHRWRAVYHLAAFPIFLSIAQVPALTEERYCLDMVPPLMIFAGFGLSCLAASLRPGKASAGTAMGP